MRFWSRMAWHGMAWSIVPTIVREERVLASRSPPVYYCMCSQDLNRFCGRRHLSVRCVVCGLVAAPPVGLSQRDDGQLVEHGRVYPTQRELCTCVQDCTEIPMYQLGLEHVSVWVLTWFVVDWASQSVNHDLTPE